MSGASYECLVVGSEGVFRKVMGLLLRMANDLAPFLVSRPTSAPCDVLSSYRSVTKSCQNTRCLQRVSSGLRPTYVESS